MKNSLIILSFFIAGLLLGLIKFLPNFLIEEDLSVHALYVLMFSVGVGVGADKGSWKIIKEINIKIILVPLTVIIGSLLGSTIISLVMANISSQEAMAVGAGFGYYSLSSIFITQISGETLGVIALMANIFRELITLILTPIFVKYFGKLAGIASGGATSMDTTLPIITEYSGKEWAVISIFSGMILTIVVPLIVPFILSF